MSGLEKVPSLFSHNGPSLETTHKSVNSGTDECIAVYSYKEILCCSNKEQMTDPCKTWINLTDVYVKEQKNKNKQYVIPFT